MSHYQDEWDNFYSNLEQKKLSEQKTLLEQREEFNLIKPTTGNPIIDLLIRNKIKPTKDKKKNMILAKAIMPRNYKGE